MSYNGACVCFLFALTDGRVFAEGQGGAPGPEHVPAWRRHTSGVSKHELGPREAVGRTDPQPCVAGRWEAAGATRGSRGAITAAGAERRRSAGTQGRVRLWQRPSQAG